MRPFEYQSAATIEEALGQLGAAARPLAGGTDLITLIKADIAAPERLLDLKRVADLPSGVVAGPDGLTIGALTTLSVIERDPQIRARHPALAEAAGLAATPQLRNMATLGGNLLQRPRCWYFRNPDVSCWLKGGDECPARDGQNQHHALLDISPCVATHPSDLATALLALDATVDLRGPAGERTLPIDEFFAPPDDGRRVETTLGPDELVLSVRLPAPPAGSRSAYLKAMDRKVWAFALVSVAARLQVSAGRIAGARLALGGVAPIPWRAAAAETVLLGAEVSDELFERAAAAALTGASPLAHNTYKLPMARALVRRALASLV